MCVRACARASQPRASRHCGRAGTVHPHLRTRHLPLRWRTQLTDMPFAVNLHVGLQSWLIYAAGPSLWMHIGPTTSRLQTFSIPGTQEGFLSPSQTPPPRDHKNCFSSLPYKKKKQPANAHPTITDKRISYLCVKKYTPRPENSSLLFINRIKNTMKTPMKLSKKEQ